MKKRNQTASSESNPFIEGSLDWMDSPEGELSGEVSDAVWQLLEKVEVDATARKLIWNDGKPLTIDQSVQRIQAQCPQYPTELIETHLISWLEMEYAPPSYSEEQLDELDRLTECWINDHYRRRPRP